MERDSKADTEERPWFRRWQSWAIIAAIVVFSVYGLIAMWLFAPWSRRSKWIITAVYLGWFALGAITFLLVGGDRLD